MRREQRGWALLKALATDNSAELWTGCNFGCVYCQPLARRWARKYRALADEALAETSVRSRMQCDPLNLEELMRRRGDRLPAVHLSVMSDPYPKIEEEAGVTSGAIEILHYYSVGVQILTKSGTRAVRDFQSRPGADSTGPALGNHPDDAYGASLTFLDEEESRKWEPGSASPAERMAGLEEAHRRGIATWATLRPVVDPAQTLELIRLTSSFVDLYGMDPLFLSPFEEDRPRLRAPYFSWPAFARNAARLCDDRGVAYLIGPDDRYDAKVRREALLVQWAMDTHDSYWAGVCRARKPRWGGPWKGPRVEAGWGCLRVKGL